MATNPEPSSIKDEGSGTVAVPAVTVNCVPGDQFNKLNWKLRMVLAPIPGPPKKVTCVPLALIEQLSKGPFALQENGPCVLLPEIAMVKLVQFFPLKFENWHVESSVPLMSQLALPVVVEKVKDVPVIAKLGWLKPVMFKLVTESAKAELAANNNNRTQENFIISPQGLLTRDVTSVLLNARVIPKQCKCCL